MDSILILIGMVNYIFKMAFPWYLWSQIIYDHQYDPISLKILLKDVLGGFFCFFFFLEMCIYVYPVMRNSLFLNEILPSQFSSHLFCKGFFTEVAGVTVTEWDPRTCVILYLDNNTSFFFFFFNIYLFVQKFCITRGYCISCGVNEGSITDPSMSWSWV